MKFYKLWFAYPRICTFHSHEEICYRARWMSACYKRWNAWGKRHGMENTHADEHMWLMIKKREINKITNFILFSGYLLTFPISLLTIVNFSCVMRRYGFCFGFCWREHFYEITGCLGALNKQKWRTQAGVCFFFY